MDGLNRVMLLGNLGAAPELKYSQDGTAILRMRLATSERWKTREGELRERVEWHSVVVFGRRAEGLAKILGKGRMVGIEGRIAYRKWEDSQGERRYATDIVATNVLLLPDHRRSGGNGGAHDDQGDAERRSGGDYDRPPPRAGDGIADDDFDPDIPF